MLRGAAASVTQKRSGRPIAGDARVMGEKRFNDMSSQTNSPHPLLNKRVAILVADGFEQVEMTKPREALEEAGATTNIVSPAEEKIQGMHHTDKGDSFDVDLPLSKAKPEEFDALMIPGGL